MIRVEQKSTSCVMTDGFQEQRNHLNAVAILHAEQTRSSLLDFTSWDVPPTEAILKAMLLKFPCA